MKLIKQKKKKGEKRAVYPSIINKECKPIFKITMKKENWGKCEAMPFPQKNSYYEIYANFNVKIRNYTLNKLWCLIENISDLQEFYLYNKLCPEAFSEGFFSLDIWIFKSCLWCIFHHYDQLLEWVLK